MLKLPLRMIRLTTFRTEANDVVSASLYLFTSRCQQLWQNEGLFHSLATDVTQLASHDRQSSLLAAARLQSERKQRFAAKGLR